MALLPATNLESHPVGTTGLNGIISGNWETLEAIFTALIAAGPDAEINWNSTAKVFTTRPAQAVLAYSATPVINAATARTLTLALTGNATFTTSNLTAGRRIQVVITADASIRTLTFPGWFWIGATPTNIAASKRGLLELTSNGTTDGSVIARWTVEP